MNRFVLIIILGLMLLGFVSGGRVDESVLKKFDEGEGRVAIIVEQKDAAQSKSLREMDVYNNDIKKIAEEGNRYTAFVSKEELEFLKSDPRVLSIQRNIPLKTFMQDVVGIVEADQSWNLKIGEINLTGTFQSVCILDTGIYRDHPALSGKILAEKCFCTVSNSGGGGCCPDSTIEDENATDDDGHGTHVAGIVGASGGINGVATNVSLVVVKIMNGTGDGNSFDLENGMQWCIDKAAIYNISVITASLGAADKETSSCDGDVPSTTTKINSAVTNNISVTIATGNNGWNDGITWPSCISNATPVGASTKVDALAYNRNSLLKLLGIGVDVNSTSYSTVYEIRGGTSMATPVVAGAISILNQALSLTGQTKTPSEIEDIFYDTGKTISELENNYSRINLYDAILSIDNIAPNVTLVSPVDNHINLTTNQTFTCNASDWQLVNVTFKVWNSTGLYSNETKNLTGTSNETSFNLTEMPLGNYAWNCLVFDSLSNFAYASSNFSLTVGGILTTLLSPANESYRAVNDTNFSCQVLSESNYELVNVTFYLWNESGELEYNGTTDISGFDNTTIFNYTLLNESGYIWNCLGVNNGTNSSFGDSNFTITYDITNPNLTLVGSLPTSETSSSVLKSFGFNISDTNLANCSLIVNGAVSLTNSSINTSITQSFSRTFTPATYTWKINCSDYAGNVNSSSENSFTITAPTVVDNSGGGGRSGGGVGISSTAALETYEVSSKEISAGYTKILKEDEKVNFSIFDFSGERHLLTVNEVGEDYVNLTIESDPINFKLGVGQSTKFNLTSQDYYDLFVKLNKIIDGEAELTIQSINEPIEKVVTETITEKEVVEVELPVIKDYIEIVIFLLIVLVLIVVVVVMANRKRLKKKTKKIKRKKSKK